MVSIKFKCSILLFAVMIIPCLGRAQTSSRDVVIHHIEEVAFGQSNVYSSSSPTIEMLLQSARSANPSTNSKTWEKVKTDMAKALTKTLSENGGPMGGVLVGALDEMSDSEIERVGKLLDDPAYRKFQAALGSSLVQQRVMQKSANNAAKINATVNDVLSINGLRIPH